MSTVYITVPCPAHILTMHHIIPKLLGAHVHYDELICGTQNTSKFKVTLRGQRSKLVLFNRTVPRPAHTLTMHHRIPRLLGTHVHHDEVTCGTQDTGLYLKGQSHTYMSMVR